MEKLKQVIKKNWKLSLLFILVWNAIISLSLIRFLDIGDCSRWNSFLVLVVSISTLILVFSLVIFLALGVIALFSQARRAKYSFLILVYLVVCVTTLGTNRIINGFEGYSFNRAVKNGEPLRLAIERFWKEKKMLPRSLNELVPQYIHEIPRTQMCSFPTYEYNNNRNNFDVMVRSGLFNGYGVMYASNKKYHPHYGQIGEWGYFNFD